MSKIKKIDFYFDISSPYSYLAHTQIRKFEKDKKIKVNYCPVFLAGLHRTADITPAGLHPQKAKHMIKDLKMCADWYKIKYQFITTFNLECLWSRWNIQGTFKIPCAFQNIKLILRSMPDVS